LSSGEEQKCVECPIDGENIMIGESNSKSAQYSKDEDNSLKLKNKLYEQNKDKFSALSEDKKIKLKCVTSAIIINKV
jgi:hypothetical protein